MILVSRQYPVKVYYNILDLCYEYNISDDDFVLSQDKIGNLKPTNLSKEQGILFIVKFRINHITTYDDKDEILKAHRKFDELTSLLSSELIDEVDEFYKDYIKNYK